ncbi:unnamed protein product [Closterium sp. Yama58-4]|nr:unnamed protein product [Closterium sp. Yama58-4]
MDFLSRATGSSDHHGQEGIPEEPDYAIRCYATKHSWRGRYKRLFCVSSSAIITLDPHSLSSTNHYTLATDYEGIVVAPPLGGKEDGQQLEFTINVRTDGRGKYKPIKFSARHRASLLTELHRVVAALHPHPPRPLTTPSTVFPVLCLRRRSQNWVPRAMRISPVGIEVIQAPVEAVSAASTPSSSSSVASVAAAVRWSVEFQGLSSPAVTVLASPEEAASGAGASGGSSSGGFFGVRRGVAGREDGGFILRLGFGRRAKAIMATGGCSNSAILSKIVDTAKGSIGRALTVDTTSRPSVSDFVSQTAVSGVGPNEPPLGEWSVTLVRPSTLLPDPSPRASSAAAGGGGATSSSNSSSSNSVAGGGLQGGLGVERSGSARQFAVTRHYFVERNPVTYEATYMRQLSTMSAVVRWVEEPQLLALEFVDGAPILVYRCAARDSLLSALKDAIETEGLFGDVEGDQLLVRHLAAAAKDAVADGGTIPGSKTRLWRRVREFNASVPYSGLSAGVDVPDVVVMAVLSMLPSPPAPPPVGNEAAYNEVGAYSAAAILPAPSPRAAGTHIGLLACLRRLVGANGAFSLVVGMPGAVGRIMGLVRSGSEAVAAEALASQVGAANQGSAAANNACNKATAARAAAKAAFFPTPVQVAAVVNRLKPRSVSPLLSAAAVAVVEALVCSPDSDTTQDATFHETLRQVANLKRRLFSLFAHPAEGTREAVAVIMCTIAEEDKAAARPMRDAALKDGAFLRHLSNSVAAAGGERRELSRQLIALWAEGHDPSLDLIRRCFPPGLCAHLYAHRDTSAVPGALDGQSDATAAASAGDGTLDSPADSAGEAGAAAVGSIRDPAAFFRSLYHRFLREADMGLVVDGVDASHNRARLSEWCDPTGEDCFGGAELQQPPAAGEVLVGSGGANAADGSVRGGGGDVLVPMPRVKRALCDPRCLPHIAQAILTNEPAIVEKAALLLEEIVRYNPTVATRLYTTGVYFFAFAYAGSNFRTIASLCHATHTRQAYVSGIEAADMASQPLAKRSILGVLLPESLLYVLDRRGAAAFAAAVVADSDSPELIWTHAMRGSVLIPQILSHLGDFPQRLCQFSRALYDHTPMPPISYPELKDEMWCHRYYLRNLCDEIRFPDWPIVEHVEFLQSLLAMWREELARKPMGISDEEACAILEIPTALLLSAAHPPSIFPSIPPSSLTPFPFPLPSLPILVLPAAAFPDKQQPASSTTPGTAFPTTRQGVQVDEDVLKRQYRRMAVRYHPDKNPEGRDKFIAVQKAYEHLQSAMQGLQGPQTWRVLLLLRAQIILFRRYPGVLEPFKYAGFPLLLQLLRLEDGDGEAGGGDARDGADGAAGGAVGGGDGEKARRQRESASSFLSPERSELLQAATHLLWLICACSSLNGEELLRDGGLPLLTTLLSRCLSLLSPSSSPPTPCAHRHPHPPHARHSLRLPLRSHRGSDQPSLRGSLGAGPGGGDGAREHARGCGGGTRGDFPPGAV